MSEGMNLMEDIYNELIKCIDKERVLQNEPMSKHTTFRIGGPADYFVIINTVEELKHVIEIAKANNKEIICIGNGSNTLVKDHGIRGIVIKLNLKEITINNNEIKAEAGVSLPVLAKKAYENSLSGLEFACGIPGSIGGAIYMNAGAHGGEFANVVKETTYLDKNLNLQTVSRENQDFSHRHSMFMDTNNIIISTILEVEKKDKDTIEKKMEENMILRKERQPIGLPSAGSVFKRNKSFIPAEIIDKCGLKGYNIGDAYISEMHAGFIINKGNAKAKDVLEVVEHIKEVVRKKYNYELELEIRVLGED